MISLTIYDPEIGEKVTKLPENTFVQLVYEHSIVAKYPRVQTIRRELEEYEKPSAVVGSSICSYLMLNSTIKSEMNSSDALVWVWDDHDCKLFSTNQTHTVCFCDHLSSSLFTNLMGSHEYIVFHYAYTVEQ